MLLDRGQKHPLSGSRFGARLAERGVFAEGDWVGCRLLVPVVQGTKNLHHGNWRAYVVAAVPADVAAAVAAALAVFREAERAAEDADDQVVASTPRSG